MICRLHHKKRYTEEAAIRAAKRQTKKSGLDVRPYLCSCGRHWHLTSRPSLYDHENEEEER